MSKAEYLNIISFSQLYMWDVKRHLIDEIQSSFPLILLSELIKENNNKVKLNQYPDKEYGILGVNNVDGLFDAYTEKGIKINQPYKQMEINELAYNPYRINVGSIGMRTQLHKNNYISPAYVVFRCNEKLKPEYLYKLFKTNTFNKIINENTTGSVRQNLKFDTLKSIKIPLPPLSEQNRIVKAYNDKIKLAEEQEYKAEELEKGIEEYLFKQLGLNNNIQTINSKGLSIIQYKNIHEWGVNKIKFDKNLKSEKFDITNLENSTELFHNLFRGKNPIYSAEDNKIILNQKCNRWNEIELKYSKTVNKEWLSRIDEMCFTQIGDILINSTGEGTIGRASVIIDGFQNLLYDSHLLLLRLNKRKINPYLFVFLFNSKYGQRQVENIKSAQTTKQTELGINNLKKVFFPLPPIELQNKIVEEIKCVQIEVKQQIKLSQKNRSLAIKQFENEIFKPCD